MGRLIFARKTNGGRCCSFKGKGGAMTKSTHQAPPNNRTHAPKESVCDQMHSIEQPKPSTAVIYNPNIPSNNHMKQNKPQMDAFTKRLESLKVKKRNISFSI